MKQTSDKSAIGKPKTRKISTYMLNIGQIAAIYRSRMIAIACSHAQIFVGVVA